LFLISFGVISQALFVSDGDITWLHSCINVSSIKGSICTANC
jgi:hypothetical protein